MIRSKTLIVVLVGAMATGACGSDTQSGDPEAGALDTAAEPSGDTATSGADAIQDNEPAAEREDVEDQDDEDVDLSSIRGDGTFSIDGTEAQAEWVLRCAPSDDFGGNPDDRDIELVAYAGDAGFLTLALGVEDLEGMGENNYTYNTFGFDWGTSVVEEQIDGFITGPDGRWFFGEASILLARGAQTTDPLDPPPFTMEGDRIIGSVDIAAIDPEQPDGAAFEFDLSIPPESIDCSEL